MVALRVNDQLVCIPWLVVSASLLCDSHGQDQETKLLEDVTEF